MCRFPTAWRSVRARLVQLSGCIAAEVIVASLCGPLWACSTCIQDEGGPELELVALLGALRSDEALDREAATQKLKELDFKKYSIIKAIFEKEKDPEVRGRLTDVLRCLASREAEFLWRDGKLNEALLKMAESNGAGNREEYVRD